MLQYIETTGKNEEEAISAALRKLGLDRDEVSVEVLERAKSGFLGIGGSPAKVKVTYEVPDAPAPKVEKPKPQPKADAPKTESPKVPLGKGAEKTSVQEDKAVPKAAEPAPDGDRTEAITTFLNGLLAHMGVSATPKITVAEDGSYKVELMGEGLGALIGRRGETLDAIQQLTLLCQPWSVQTGAYSCGRRRLPGQAGGISGASGSKGSRKGGQVPPERHPGAHERL